MTVAAPIPLAPPILNPISAHETCHDDDFSFEIGEKRRIIGYGSHVGIAVRGKGRRCVKEIAWGPRRSGSAISAIYGDLNPGSANAQILPRRHQMGVLPR